MNRAWIELDQHALKNNITIVQRELAPGCKLMGVVKANAYGHGACLVANALQSFGIEDFAVATSDEGVELRKSGILGQILVLGYTSPAAVDTLLAYRLAQAVVSTEYANELETACAAAAASGPAELASARLDVHLAIDTGMHRIGILPDDIDGMKSVYDMLHLTVKGIFSHLCVADTDEPQHVAFTKKQIDTYFHVVERLRAAGVNVTGLHLQNSYGCVNYTPLPCDYARLGILLYGAKSSSSDYMSKPMHFMPVMSLRAHITSVREIAAGETVSYGRTFTAERPTKIASVAIGYADGIPRNLSGGKLRALVHGKSVHGVGRICMDQFMLDVTDVPNVKAGDVVTLIGRDGSETITAEEICDTSNSITNELFSRLSPRIENRGFVDAACVQ